MGFWGKYYREELEVTLGPKRNVITKTQLTLVRCKHCGEPGYRDMHTVCGRGTC